MVYSLKLPPQIQQRIREYLAALEATDNPAVIRAIDQGLQRIAADPSVGSVLSSVYNRPVYRHFFRVDGTQYNFQAAYLVDDEDESVTISTFGGIPF